MGRRNSSGEGTVYYNAKTKRYTAKIRWVDPATKKLKWKTFTEPRQSDAKRRMDEFKRLYLDAEKAYQGDYKNILFNDYLEKWMRETKQLTLKPTTYASMWGFIRMRIAPYFQGYYIYSISYDDIQRFVNSLTDRSYSYARQCRDIITACIEHFYERYSIGRQNPGKRVTLPLKKKLEAAGVRFYNREERNRILAAATSLTSEGKPRHRLGYAVQFLMFTGMRFGEAAALTWKDIDEEDMIININKHVMRIDNLPEWLSDYSPEELAKKRYDYVIEPGAKTANGTRTIPIATKALEAIHQLKKINGKTPFLFANMSGKPIQLPAFNRMFRSVLREAGIEYGPKEKHGVHTLRHTFASMMIESGADLKTISEILGHSNTQFTANIYVHLTNQHKAKMIKNLDDFVD